MLGKFTLSFIATLSLILSCKESGFKSGGEGVRAGDQNAAFSCDAGQNASSGVRDVRGIGGTKFKVNGQFCSSPAQKVVKQELTVLYVVDFSGSMQQADPLVGGSCGRLENARIVTSKLKPAGATAEDLANIKIGVVSFDYETNPEVPIQSITSFEPSALTPKNFCGTEGDGTNYEAAFKAAADTLASITGPKLVLFLSDGIPLSYIGHKGSWNLTPDEIALAKEKGRQAAMKLLALPDTKLKIAYLDKNREKATEDYLYTLVNGVTTDVQFATSASELVEQAKLIEIPLPTPVQSNNVVAVVRTPGFPDKNVTVKLTPSAVQNVWDYETEQFELQGKIGTTTINELTVTATTSDGHINTSVVKINFTQSI